MGGDQVIRVGSCEWGESLVKVTDNLTRPSSREHTARRPPPLNPEEVLTSDPAGAFQPPEL